MSTTRLASLFALALALPATAQQLWFAQNDNQSYGSYAAGWPASVIAFRFTAPANAVIAAAEVFTGNQTPSPHSVEIAAHDPVTNNPGALLGQPGSFTSTSARSWQGAALAQPAPVVQGSDYWLIWRVGGMFPQHSLSADNNPANVLVDMRVSDGTSWHASTMQAGKFRLFTPATAGSVAAFGAGKAGQYGVPTMGVAGFPSVGGTIDVWLAGAARRQPALLFLGWPIPAGIAWPFATQYTTSDLFLLFTTETLTSPLSGGASTTLHVPNLPALSGMGLALQWAVFDPQAQAGISHTDAATVSIQ